MTKFQLKSYSIFFIASILHFNPINSVSFDTNSFTASDKLGLKKAHKPILELMDNVTDCFYGLIGLMKL